MANLISIGVEDAAWEYLDVRRTQGKAANTRRNDMNVLLAFARSAKVSAVRAVEARHVSAFLGARAQTRGLRSLALDLAVLRMFFKWCRGSRYLPVYLDPCDGHTLGRPPQREFRRIPAEDFPRVLDCAPWERTRMVVSLGLYLFLRVSEMRLLKWKDVNLKDGEVQVLIEKVGKRDVMPIPEELDQEFRRYLTFLTKTLGPPQPEWYVLPWANHIPASPFAEHAEGRMILEPTRKAGQLSQQVKRTLEAYGFPLADEDGNPTREAGHTLRRSGARALFDRLLEDGYDGALRTVQAMLHHASGTMTEHYLGIDLDKKRRDELLKGKKMFPVPAQGNVVRLVPRAEGERGGDA